MRTETIELGGAPFFLRSWGDSSKPVLLMLHGFPEFGGAWQELAPHLANHYYCLAPDQRGYGQSWTPDGVEHYSGAALTADMAALINRFGGKATVLGHDWGAAVAYGLAMFHGDMVERLVILNGVHPVPFQRALARGGPQAEASQYINFLRRPDSHEQLAADNFQKLVQFFAANANISWLTEERLESYRAEWARPGKLNTMINWYRASPLQVPPTGQTIKNLPEWPREKLTVHCPHLLIWGMEDRALLPEATEGLEDFAPSLTRIEMAGVDHWLCHQKPADVAAHFLNWSAA